MTDFFAQAVSGVRNLAPYQPGKPIAELERELGITDIVKLASNENPHGTPASVKNALAAALDDLTLYPDGSGFQLKQKLASKFAVKPEQLTLGNGSNEILDIIARVFLQPGDNAVVSQHTFIVYPIAVQAVGAELKVAPAKNFGHDLDAMAKLIDTNTKLVFIANPNNPTGTWLTGDELRGFMQQVPAHVLVVVDEAYNEFVERDGFISALALLNDFPNIIVSRTFSKAYGLAGLRVGYSISNTQVADLLNRLREPFNVNSLALLAAEVVLDDAEYLAKSQANNAAGMAQLEAGFAQLGLPFIPSASNCICVDFGKPAGPIYDALLKEGVIVRPIGVYEMPTWLRVSIGLPHENQRLLDALAKVLAA